MDVKPALRNVAREAMPLQPLSPERINSIRPSSKSTTELSIETRIMERPSPQSSPTRKANLFADYHPSTRTEAKDLGFGLPQSPSMPEFNAFRNHVRTNSDVQGLVKRFEHLDVRDPHSELMERKKRHEAELRRAQMAREEAESDVKKLREEVRRMKKECDEGRDRERKVSKRLEVVIEEFAGLKDSHASQITAYDKENRKSRKEAFKSSSAVVKLQEELKATRNTLHVTQSNLQMEKLKGQKRDQEAFSAQYKSVALEEEIGQLKSYVLAVEQEKEALKASLHEEEVAKIAAQGMIALPIITCDDDLLVSPRKPSPHKRLDSPLSDDKENAGVITRKTLETRRLEEEIARERSLREHAEQVLEFLRLECRFQCCFCRVQDTASCDDILDLSRELNETMESIKKDMMDAFGCYQTLLPDDEDMDQTIRPPQIANSGDKPTDQLSVRPTSEIESIPHNPASESEDIDTSMTLTGDIADENTMPKREIQVDKVTEETRMALDPIPISPEIEMSEQVIDDDEEEEGEEEPTTLQSQPQSPQTSPSPQRTIPPRQRPSIRTITTTTTIPMQFSPAKPTPQSFEESQNTPTVANFPVDHPELGTATTPVVIDREAALAAIAYRRGRAKSIAEGHATPRKQMIEGLNILQRRDISAPLLGQKTAGADVIVVQKGSASVGRAMGRTA